MMHRAEASARRLFERLAATQPHTLRQRDPYGNCEFAHTTTPISNGANGLISYGDMTIIHTYTTTPRWFWKPLRAVCLTGSQPHNQRLSAIAIPIVVAKLHVHARTHTRKTGLVTQTHGMCHNIRRPHAYRFLS